MVGTFAIKRMEAWSAPFLLVLGLSLLGWAWYQVGDLGNDLGRQPADLCLGQFQPWQQGSPGPWIEPHFGGDRGATRSRKRPAADGCHRP